MARFQPRKQLFDYGEAEETQFDMVNAVEDAGSWASGLQSFYQSQDEKMEDEGMGGFWGQFSKKAIEGKKPEYASLDLATRAVKKMTGSPKDALQEKIMGAMQGDYKGMTDNARWMKQSSNWLSQNTVESVTGQQGAGLLGTLEKVPGVGELVKSLSGKVAGSGLGSAFAKANAIAAPFMLAKGIHTAASGISDADRELEGQEQDVGMAGKAIQQSTASTGTEYHDMMRDSVNRVKEAGSSLNKEYGATALKVLSNQDITTGKSNLESSDLLQGSQGDVMNSLTTARISASDNIQKQADYQTEQGIGQYVDATSSLLGQYQQNQKLHAEIGDQRDKMKGMVDIARMVPFVS